MIVPIVQFQNIIHEGVELKNVHRGEKTLHQKFQMVPGLKPLRIFFYKIHHKVNLLIKELKLVGQNILLTVLPG